MPQDLSSLWEKYNQGEFDYLAKEFSSLDFGAYPFPAGSDLKPFVRVELALLAAAGFYASPGDFPLEFRESLYQNAEIYALEQGLPICAQVALGHALLSTLILPTRDLRELVLKLKASLEKYPPTVKEIGSSLYLLLALAKHDLAIAAETDLRQANLSFHKARTLYQGPNDLRFGLASGPLANRLIHSLITKTKTTHPLSRKEFAYLPPPYRFLGQTSELPSKSLVATLAPKAAPFFDHFRDSE